MKLLLDTHCLIWLLTAAPQLGAASRSVIADADGVWFSGQHSEMSDALDFLNAAQVHGLSFILF